MHLYIRLAPASAVRTSELATSGDFARRVIDLHPRNALLAAPCAHAHAAAFETPKLLCPFVPLCKLDRPCDARTSMRGTIHSPTHASLRGADKTWTSCGICGIATAGRLDCHGGLHVNAGMPDDFYEEAKDLLPPEPPAGPKGRRPRLPNRTCVKMERFGLIRGVRWQNVPHELGRSGRTVHRRLEEWKKQGILDRLHAWRLEIRRRAGKLPLDMSVIHSFHVRAFGGGEATGPSPSTGGKTARTTRCW